MSYDLKPSMGTKYSLEFGNVFFVTVTGVDEGPFWAYRFVGGV